MSSIAKVKEYLARFDAAGRVLELDHSSATVGLAAQALGVEGARIAKSLSFHMGEGCMIIVMAGDVKVDNARFKATFGFKAKMLTADEALAMTGHAVGGVCPQRIGFKHGQYRKNTEPHSRPVPQIRRVVP